jgi:hypothetical protein
MTAAEQAQGYCPRCRHPLNAPASRPQDRLVRRDGPLAGPDTPAPFALQMPLWCTVRTGLSLLAVGTFLIVIGGVALFLLLMSDPTDAVAGGAWRILMGLAGFGVALYWIGMTLCWNVPEEAVHRGLLTALIIVHLLAVMILLLLVGSQSTWQDRAMVTGLLAMMWVVAHHLLAAMLAMIARAMRSMQVFSSGLALITVSGMLHAVVFALAVMGIGFSGTSVDPTTAQIMLWVAWGLWEVFLVWFLVQVVLVRTLIVNRIQKELDAHFPGA